MVKNSTLLKKTEKLEKCDDVKNECNENVIFYYEDNSFSPSQKSIDFILNFSKSFYKKAASMSQKF